MNMAASNDALYQGVNVLPVAQVLRAALTDMDKSPPAGRLERARLIALCGKDALALSILLTLAEEDPGLSGNAGRVLARLAPALRDGGAGPLDFFRLLAGAAVDRPMAPPAGVAVAWEASAAGRCVFEIRCPHCLTATLASPNSDFLADERLTCPACLRAVSFPRRQAADSARAAYLARLAETEALLAASDPRLADELVRLIQAALILEGLVPVRFVLLRAERIGHFALNTELFHLEQRHIHQEEGALNICCHTEPVCNEALFAMWSRVVVFSPLARIAYDICQKAPSLRRLALDIYNDDSARANSGQDRHGLLDVTSPVLTFTPGEQARAEKSLRAMGMKPQTPFACFLARDGRYLEQHMPGRSFAYHDYRNMPAEDFLPAMEMLADAGAFSLRMGHVVDGELEGGRPEIVDYASRHRTPFMDVYLAGNCGLFVSSGTGLDAVGTIFRRNVCMVNLLPYGCTPLSIGRLLVIHKKLRLIAEGRFLSYQEAFESGAAFYYSSEKYADAGLEVVNNTPGEIREAVREAWLRAHGQWTETEEDRELQERVRAIFKRWDAKYACVRVRIGSAFLRASPELLA